MRPAEPGYDAMAVWDIAVPPRAGRVAGVTMAGFRARCADPVDLAVVPYPAVTVAVNLGDGPLTVGHDGSRRHDGSVVAGLAPGQVRVHGQRIECLQVRLSPVAAHAVLGPCSQLAGTVASLDDLWGRDAARVQQQLRAATSWQQRFAIARAALARRLQDGPAADPEVIQAWQQMTATRGQARIEALAAEAGWSRKRLWSRFRSQLGLSPKRAAQLIRFDHAAHRLAAGHRPAQVAADTGYTDQSHLHRDAITFAGTTPATLATAPWLAVDPIAWTSPRPQLTPQPTPPYRGGMRTLSRLVPGLCLHLRRLCAGLAGLQTGCVTG